MLKGGMAGRVFTSLAVKAKYSVGSHGFLALISAGPRAFSLSSFWGKTVQPSPVFSSLLSNQAIWPKKKGYIGPAPSSGLVNRPHGGLSNRSWVMDALLQI